MQLRLGPLCMQTPCHCQGGIQDSGASLSHGHTQLMCLEEGHMTGGTEQSLELCPSFPNSGLSHDLRLGSQPHLGQECP